MKIFHLNRIGIIRDSKHPKEIGWYVAVRDDAQNTGGYKLFTSNNKDFFGTADGDEILFNNWVEYFSDIEKFITESKWEIDWTTESLPSDWRE